MAIGAARVMGIKLMTNFDKPYQSGSIHEFWKRWHISLSTWFKDYLYISLGGNRVSVPRWYFNLFIVFVISGLWHGASWSFVIWGALHGFYLVFALLTRNIRERINKLLYFDKVPFLQTVTTFLLVAFAWIFFRANTIQDALYISTHIFSGMEEVLSNVLAHTFTFDAIGLTKTELIFSVFLILFLEIVHYYQSKTNLAELFRSKPLVVRWSVYFAMVMVILIFGLFESKQFIYFQF